MALKPRGLSDVLLTLDVIIRDLSLVKETCGILPAQATFNSTDALLTMIRVRLTLFPDDEPLTRVRLGLHGRREGLRPTGALLRRCM
jgi:hypothetical protein